MRYTSVRIMLIATGGGGFLGGSGDFVRARRSVARRVRAVIIEVVLGRDPPRMLREGVGQQRVLCLLLVSLPCSNLKDIFVLDDQLILRTILRVLRRLLFRESTRGAHMRRLHGSSAVLQRLVEVCLLFRVWREHLFKLHLLVPLRRC